jgi:hypothetical protein
MKRMRFLTALAVFAALTFTTTAVFGAEARSDLSWTATTERVDCTPLPQSEIAEYRIYYSVDAPVTGSETPVVVSNTAVAETVTLFLNPRAESYVVSFSVSTVDTMGQESELSAPVSKVFEVNSTANPNAPTNLQVTITCGEGCTISPVLTE